MYGGRQASATSVTVARRMRNGTMAAGKRISTQARERFQIGQRDWCKGISLLTVDLAAHCTADPELRRLRD